MRNFDLKNFICLQTEAGRKVEQMKGLEKSSETSFQVYMYSM